MVLTWTILILYLALLVWLMPGWRKSQAPGEVEHLPKVSIIVVARNEATNLPDLLADFDGLHYPAALLDTWIVDDHSDDGTAHLIAQHQNNQLIQLAHLALPAELVSYKKWGLTEAIQRCHGDIILTTDADCRVQPNWVRQMVAAFSNGHVQAVAGPVAMQNSSGLLGHFQRQDMLGLQLVTGGGLARGWPILANGANLAFRKSAWDTVGGYTGINQQPSGDDILLILKIHDRFPRSIHYCSNPGAVVTTKPVGRWIDFWQQRLRWVSKIRHMSHPAARALMVLGWAANASMLVALILLLLGVFNGLSVLAALLAKMTIEGFAIYLSGKKLGQEIHWPWYPLVALLYLPYVTFAGILGNFIPYRWKGRTNR